MKLVEEVLNGPAVILDIGCLIGIDFLGIRFGLGAPLLGLKLAFHSETACATLVASPDEDDLQPGRTASGLSFNDRPGSSAILSLKSSR